MCVCVCVCLCVYIYIYTNLETEVQRAHSNTANITEYLPVGNILSQVKSFKGKHGKF
jgi:uncharacterized membrane protein YecN with MAPEG domain